MIVICHLLLLLLKTAKPQHSLFSGAEVCFWDLRN